MINVVAVVMDAVGVGLLAASTDFVVLVGNKAIFPVRDLRLGSLLMRDDISTAGQFCSMHTLLQPPCNTTRDDDGGSSAIW